mmetsp:Transcript_4172/g.8618  ORF Transcript_4172/g.8618 Transcript_4172/m.8618 type:complete len:225 (+) Transcript_4172:121-795(+)
MKGIDSCVIVRKNGPRRGSVIIRSKSTRRSLPSCANPCMIAVRTTRVREYPPSDHGTSLVWVTFDSSSTRRYPSSVAWHPPCPRLGIMGCAASPHRATGPLAQGLRSRWGSSVVSRGAPSYRSRLLMSSSLLASISSRAKGSQTLPSSSPSPVAANSLRSRVSFGWGSSGVGSGSTPPAGSRMSANHCCLSPPPSVLTKYFFSPRSIWYDTVSMFEARCGASAA